MTTCTVATCRQDYDETNAAAAAHHTEPVYCSKTSKRCNRCDGMPSCYMCGSSFCFCHDH
ncbi:hypothetical protein [Streptomyces sp. NPDC059016]|uniref:hypothetical protein n=1 Tax=Streptomyces sp. NPDC059016 TaxID=3346699 RepID=UPI00369AF9C5